MGTPKQSATTRRPWQGVRPDRGRRYGLLLLVALALLAIAGLKGWRLYARGQALRADVAQLAGLADEPDLEALAQAGPLLAQARRHAAALQSEAAPLFWLSDRLGWLPAYGPTLAAARPTLAAAAELSAAGDEAYQALTPLIFARDPARPIGEALVGQLQAAAPRLQAARAALDRADAAWEQIPLGSLAPALRDPLGRIDPLRPLAREGLELALAAPELLGAHGPRTYLVVAQNPDELRATGGFITAAGRLTVERGRLVDLSIRDSGEIGDVGRYVYPDPPEPLRRYMGLEMWLFRDANWSPDFPTAARTAVALYNLSDPGQISGVVAFDPAALQLILAATGPLDVAGSPAPVGADTVIAWLRDGPPAGDARPWAARRKDLLAPLARALLDRLARPERLDPRALAGALRQALDGRHIQLYLDDPVAAELLARRGWDGALRPGAGDFLMLVDSNVGYNKVTPHIERRATYRVDLSDPAAPLADLSLRYTHRLPAAGPCDQAAGYEAVWQITRYEDWMRGCYWDYLRVLLPRGSQLITATARPVPAEWLLSGVGDAGRMTIGAGDAGTAELRGLLVVAQGGDVVQAARYRLPAGVLSRDGQGYSYRLTLQPQAGAAALPVVVQVQLPPGAELVDAAPPATTRAGQLLSFSFELTGMRELVVRFRQS